MKKVIRTINGILVMCLMVWLSSVYIYYWKQTPQTIKIEKGSTQRFSLCVPANGKLTSLEKKEKVADVFLMSSITMTAGDMPANYEMDLKLYGILPFKKVSVQVVDDKKVWPVGELYGFYLETEGVLVIGIGEFTDVNGKKASPAKELLKEGDYLLRVNGEEIKGKREFQNMVEESDGRELNVDGERNGHPFTVTVTPEKYQDGSYKLGMWIRDNAQGVGTVTYIDESGEFGALGHPITDSDTNQILNIKDGKLYDAQVISILKGEKNHVGEVKGLIDYQRNYLEGQLLTNENNGIYGYSGALYQKYQKTESIPVAMRQEVHTGNAKILCNVSGEQKEYEIEITDVRMDEHTNQAISIRIIDSELIALTGGIVQGMSGCPILQDGKFVGAVTHVLISDSKKGYGIFLEDMLNTG